MLGPLLSLNLARSNDLLFTKGHHTATVAASGKTSGSRSGNRIRKPYSLTEFFVPPTTLVRVRCEVRVHGSGLGFWNLAGGIRDLVGE